MPLLKLGESTEFWKKAAEGLVDCAGKEGVYGDRCMEWIRGGGMAYGAGRMAWAERAIVQKSCVGGREKEYSLVSFPVISAANRARMQTEERGATTYGSQGRSLSVSGEYFLAFFTVNR